MPFSQPARKLPDSAVEITGSNPAKLFPARLGGDGWQCENNTGSGVWFVEVRLGEIPSAAQVVSAGKLCPAGSGIEGDSRTGDVYAMLAVDGTATIFPQERTL